MGQHGQGDLLRGHGPLHIVFLCSWLDVTGKGCLAQGFCFIYFDLIKGWLKTKNMAQVSWQKAFTCALRT